MTIIKNPDTLYLDSISLQNRIGTAGKLVVRKSDYVELVRFTLNSTPFGTPNLITGTMQMNGTPISSTISANGTAAIYTIETAFGNTSGNTYIFSVDSGTDVFTTTTANSIVNGQILQFSTAGTLPSPLLANIDYFAINVSGSTFKVSATFGGSAINITTTGSGTLNVRSLVVIQGVCGSNYIFSASGSILTATNHNLTNGAIVQLTTTGTLPAPLAVLTNYYVINVSGATLQLSLTSGGSAITLTDTGSGVHRIKNILVDFAIDSGAADPLALTSGSLLAISTPFTHTPN
jgi:hypothetical protein